MQDYYLFARIFLFVVLRYYLFLCSVLDKYMYILWENGQEIETLVDVLILTSEYLPSRC